MQKTLLKGQLHTKWSGDSGKTIHVFSCYYWATSITAKETTGFSRAHSSDGRETDNKSIKHHRMLKMNNHKPLTSASISTFAVAIFDSLHRCKTCAFTAAPMFQSTSGAYDHGLARKWDMAKIGGQIELAPSNSTMKQENTAIPFCVMLWSTASAICI